MKKIRLGLIGASKIAARVLPSIMKVDEITIGGVASRDKGRSNDFANKWQIPKVFASYAECVNSSEIDCVYISTLNSQHFGLIVESLEAGKHVLCEKPLVLNESDAITIYRIAEERNLILLEGFMYRFHPQVQELLRSSKSTIGKVKHVNLNFSFLMYDQEDLKQRARATKDGGGGALNDLGCYAVDFINQIVGARKLKSCFVVMNLQNGIDLDTTVLLNYENDLSASLRFSIVSPGLNLWEIIGDNGAVAALRFDSQGSLPVPLYFVDNESKAVSKLITSPDIFEMEFRNFARSILRLELSHISPAESIRNALLLETIRAASTN